jgi:hypothetical protein
MAAFPSSSLAVHTVDRVVARNGCQFLSAFPRDGTARWFRQAAGAMHAGIVESVLNGRRKPPRPKKAKAAGGVCQSLANGLFAFQPEFIWLLYVRVSRLSPIAVPGERCNDASHS